MKANRITRSAICLAQTVLLVAGNGSIVFAASSTSGGSLDKFEQSVFGETHSKLTESERLKDLEVNLFGKVHTGTPSARISEISKALGGGGKSDNLLMPAMAPQLDTSTSHASSAAPASNYDNDASTSEPAITASGDAEKETLRHAMQLYSQGKTEEAEKQFHKALTINRNSADAYYNLGVIAEGKGDLQGALNNYRSASRINPSDTDLASAISGVETKLQDKNNAAQHERQSALQAAQEQQQQRKVDNLKPMINTAAAAYKSGDYDKAISNLTYVSQQAPDDADVLYALGQAYKGKGDLSHARGAYNSAIAVDPSNSLYKDALAGLNRLANNGASSSNSYSGGGYSGGPAPAPNRKNKHPGQLTSFTGGGSSSDYSNNNGSSNGYSSGGSNDGGGGSSGGSAGQLTPFSGVANGSTSGLGDEYSNNTPGGVGQGYISSSSGRSGLLGGLGSLGSLGGIGVSMLGGSMLGGGVRYNGGYNSTFYGRSPLGGYGRYGGGYGGSSTRIKRVAIGGLTGAAAGALYGGMSHGGVKSSAMKGALMGAAMGLFMGGF